MTTTEKVAYLKGLVDASDLPAEAKETRIIHAIVDALEDIALTLSDVEDQCTELTAQVDAIDEDLDALEQDYYDIDDDEDDYDGEQYEVECPACHESLVLDEEIILDGATECPSCGEPLEFDVHFADDDCCDCHTHAADDNNDED